MSEGVHLKVTSSGASAIDAYFEYRNIVGDDDDGILFTPKEYEAYKKKVLPMRMKNRMYVSWSNPTGLDCKLIGPETMCFCQHRYKGHRTDFTESVSESSEIQCKVKSCKCSGFKFVPKNGNQFLRCHCKHLVTEHQVSGPYPCGRCKCREFDSSFRCGCGYLINEHKLIIETREQRAERGHPVANYETPYQAMGGLTGLSSLIDGYMRLDDSGIGKPPVSYLEASQPSTSYSPLQITSNRTAPGRSHPSTKQGTSSQNHSP
ncbi:unnamed protein product [Clavelina lepadiformis]|uniref:Protein FAM221A n=1 Tax=Clavelina lepadiformis TaxID=159417 RepID=A0ABP0G3A1_CLALP